MATARPHPPGVPWRWWPIALLLLLPALWFPGALPGPDVVSADDHLTVHHAYGDPAAGRVRHPHLSDAAMQFGGLRVRVVEALRAGRAPLWNPDLYGGAPLLADGQSMVGSPVTWARLVLPEDAAQDAGVTFVVLCAALGSAALGAALGAGPWGAVVAGAAVATSPYLSVWMLHPHAAVFCWLPWLLWAIERRRPVATALLTAALIGGGHPGTIAHALGLAAAWWLLRRRDLRVGCGLAVGLVLCAPLWLPLVEQGLRSTTLAARGGTSLGLPALLDLVWPGWWGHPADETWRGTGAWANGQLHPGLGAGFLALLALSAGRARGLFAAWAACVGLALSGLLPGPFDHARLASEGALFLGLAAAIGARSLPGPLRPVALVAVVLTGLHARSSDQSTLPAEAHDPAPAAWVASVRAATGCPGADCGRVLGLDWVLQPNTGARVGLRDLRGYDLPISAETHELMGALAPRPQGPWYPVAELPELALLQLADVRVVLTDLQTTVALPPLALPADASVRAWRVPEPRGRAWLSPDDSGASGPTLAVSGTPERVTMVASGPGVVARSEAWAPGWSATVDGEAREVVRVGRWFQGVGVSAAGQEVVFAYRPWGWAWGLRLGLLGLAALLGLSIWGRRAPTGTGSPGGVAVAPLTETPISTVL